MGRFSDFLKGCIDTACAPAGASDPCSDVHSHSSMNSESGAEWHNNFGTLADYQVPAEAYDCFQSNDWSSGCDFGSTGFGSDF